MTPNGTNRRSWGRMPATAFADLKATLNSGVDVELVNLSRGGAQFRTSKRMLPGLGVTLNLGTSDGRMTMKGKVMRSSMVKLSDGSLGYEVGVAFDLELGTPGRVPAQERAEAANSAPGPAVSGDRPATAGAPDSAAAPESGPAVAAPQPAPVIDAGIEDFMDPNPGARGRASRSTRRGPQGKGTPAIEILDPDHRARVDVNADVPGQSLDGLLDLLK